MNEEKFKELTRIIQDAIRTEYELNYSGKCIKELSEKDKDKYYFIQGFVSAALDRVGDRLKKAHTVK